MYSTKINLSLKFLFGSFCLLPSCKIPTTWRKDAKLYLVNIEIKLALIFKNCD